MHPGDIVAGKYRVANILGRSRGLLLEASHTEFDQRVIIRLLSRALCNDKEIEQFRREAKTLAKLESEYVGRIIDVGTHSDGSFFLVRQYLEGVDLATHIRSHGALRLEEAVLYILQAAEAVTECHHHNIILRELQPAHLFLTKKRGGTPMVKVIDFGTAKLMKDPAGEVVNGEMTATVMFGMSPHSSPELVRKVKGIDVRTDVWSLGCILYEMLAAVSPFQGEMAELMLKITREDPIPLSSLRPDLPREFDQIIGWALAKDRDSRFKSVYAFAHALKPYASAEGQVLVDQIGRLTHAERKHDGPKAISPTSPLAKRGTPAAYTDDDATVIRQVQSHAPESPFEKTTFLPDADKLDARRGSVPPPPMDRSSYPSPAMDNSRGSVPPPRARQGSWIEPDPVATSGLSANATGGYPAQTALGMHHKQRQRKMAVIAIGGALVMLPVLVVVLIFALRDTSGGELAQNDPAPPATVPVTPPAADDNETDPEPAASSSAAADASAQSEDVPPDASSKVAAAQPTSGKTPWSNPKSATGDKVGSAPPEPVATKKKKTTSSSEESGTGTLVAIAIGGSCAFAVDGAGKGTKSSIRMKVSVGPHTVSCTPQGGASRTQRVNVKAGTPGIASFRLN